MTAAEAREYEIKSISLNTASYYVYVDAKTMKNYEDNWSAIDQLNRDPWVGGSSDESKENCLIVTSHSKELTKEDIEKVIEAIANYGTTH